MIGNFLGNNNMNQIHHILTLSDNATNTNQEQLKILIKQHYKAVFINTWIALKKNKIIIKSINNSRIKKHFTHAHIHYIKHNTKLLNQITSY